MPMYTQYFGLNDSPFSISPNPHYLFMSDKHREALGHLLYGVGVGGGFVLLTGEVGTGKTTICRCLLEQLPENTDVAFVLNPLQNARELLENISEELGIEITDDQRTLRGLSNALYRFLLANHARGRNTVLLIDEAQNLDTKVLELIRLLTNLETNTKKLLQIIFIGQPELQAILEKPELRQLAQRITARFHIEPLNEAETQAYIRHRLQVAGLPASQQLFPPAIMRRIHQRCGGIPRLINVLCDRVLLGTYSENKTQVDRHTLTRAAREVLGTGATKLPPRWALGTAAALVLGLGLYALWPAPPAITAPVSTATPEANASTPISNAPLATAPIQRRVEQPPPDPLDALIEQSFLRRAGALSALFTHLQLPQLSGPAPCRDTRGTGMNCAALTLDNWNGLLRYNRPAVIELNSGDGRMRYVALLGLQAGNAHLLHRNGTSEVPLLSLSPLWSGDVIFAWSGPEDYQKPLAEGDEGEAVRWVAARFAELDAQPKALTDNRFNRALTQRVKLFQQAQGLESDGIVGLNTLLKLSDALALDNTLVKVFVEKSEQAPSTPVSEP
ncbi:AAA family ATPase [Simiduia sp. 21SJ11W-1]|uniref:ExeA family protein n=1 Tax=Simiduia sp. 21SJ11W-1 TaxID=2909669 RepID=UPI00209E26E7|nr:ExeA family protein [Simiduia sp. 21SJ11W-1]UTA47761.1 AAA family ATPase [Simiduia sp. 21SJ11W-1]